MAPSSRKRPRKDTVEDLEHQGRAPQSSSKTVVEGIPPGKKARLRLIDDDHSVSTAPTQESHILKLPVEILGEILILTGSSQHVLAVARTCKQFCYTLLDEGAQYIWRKARHGLESFVDFKATNSFLEKVVISMPDPPKEFFSEAAYAAFFFDPGTCFNCGKTSPIPYASFALRIRICHRTSCSRLPDDLEDADGFELLVPTTEMSDITARSGHELRYWPDHYETFGRKTDIYEGRNQFLSENSEVQAKLPYLRERNGKWMKFCSALAEWKIRFNEEYLRVEGINAETACAVAAAFGYEKSLLNCTVFATLCKQKTRFLETVDLSDVGPMQEQIEVELLALDEKRQRSKIETSLMKNRADIEGLYKNLRSNRAYRYLPSLATFRQLPVIQLLEAGTYDGISRTKIADTLQSGTLIRQRLDQDVERWVATAKQDLAAVLGFPKQWKSPNRHLLHPVERGTAWFICKICGTDEANYKTGGCLDFAGACLHVCKDGKNNRHRKGKKAAWDSEKFTTDEKGINTMKNILTKLWLSEESVRFFPKYNGVAVLCTSCNPSMVLDSSDLIRHSHQHDNMEVSKISRDEAVQCLGGFQYSSGVVKQLLRQGGAAIQMEINKKNFGCRICLRKRQDSSGENPGIKPFERGDVSSLPLLNACFLSEKPKEVPPLFNFNGMRSHLKAKHGIEHIRDEYFLCAKPIGDNTPIGIEQH